MDEPVIGEVFVPTVEEEGGNIIGLGIFSSEKIALNVLKDYFKHSWKGKIVSANLARWQVDLIGQDALTLLAKWSCQVCPICDRPTFWIDLDSFSALCHGTACGAWMEDNIHETEIIDIGLPAIRWLHQARSIKKAMSEFRKKAAEMRSAGGDVDDEMVDYSMEDAKTRMERILRKEGSAGLGIALADLDNEEE